MSSHIQEGLKGSGVARVIVVLRAGLRAMPAPDPEPILRHFVSSEYSQVAALAGARRTMREIPPGLLSPSCGSAWETSIAPPFPASARTLALPAQPSGLLCPSATRESRWHPSRRFSAGHPGGEEWDPCIR